MSHSKSPQQPDSAPDASKTPPSAHADIDDKRKNDTTQNDRAASHESGMGSNSGQRDMTSGRQSGNQ